MNLQAASFCSGDIERYGMGAGIVPMATRPEDGAVCFLLGRERWMPSWKGSCRWSGFQGARKEHEEMLVTASREFDEESMGSCLSFDREEVQRRLREGDYWIRVVLRIVNEHRRSAHRYHSTHVMRIAWDEAIPRRFQEVRAGVEYVDRLVQELRHTRPRVLHLLTDVGDIVDGTSPASSVVVQHGTEGLEGRRETVFTEPDDVEALRAWRLVRERLDRALAQHVHRCVRVVRDSEGRHVTDVQVCKDFLEKDQVRWWTTDELTDVFRNRGTHGNERFRPYFLPVLQTILHEHAREFDPNYDPERQVGTAVPRARTHDATEDTLEGLRRAVPWRASPAREQGGGAQDQWGAPCSGSFEVRCEEVDEDESTSSSTSRSPPSTASGWPWCHDRPWTRVRRSSHWRDAWREGEGEDRMPLDHRRRRGLRPPSASPPSGPRRWHRTRPRETTWTLRDRGARSRSAP